MTKKLLRGIIISAAFVFVLGFVPVAAFAEDDDRQDDSTTTTSAQEDEEEKESEDESTDKSGALRQRLQALKEQRQANQEKRLDAVKLKVCENRKAKITSIINRSITRADRQLDLFTKIAERVKAFYVDKGYTLANYDELVAATDAAKAKAEANLETLKGLDAFDCDVDDPKGSAEAFKLALQSVNQDLKDYRTAVKNLIVGVKSAQNNGSDEAQGGDE